MIDFEDYLARLLRLKLAAMNLDLRRLAPTDLESEKTGDQEIGGGAVIVSLPQPGISSWNLLRLVRERFPGLSILELTSDKRPELSLNRLEPSSGELRFSKPLVELDNFFKIIKKVTTNHLSSSEKPAGLEMS
ncbi:MAG: hypothetical protein HQK55_18820 [Deltaproteobacteria bacterium]|nr:hypothetical protein [Deltaproteobacteria bacterium]